MIVSRRSLSWSWSPSPKVHLSIALGMSLIALTLSGVFFFLAYKELNTNPVVEGLVVDSIGGGDGVHTPIIEYNSPSGDATRFTSKLSSPSESYLVGEAVKVVLVGPELKPKLKTFITVYGLSTFCLIFSLISALGTTVIYFTRVKRTKA